jgi:hypothetical protein
MKRTGMLAACVVLVMSSCGKPPSPAENNAPAPPVKWPQELQAEAAAAEARTKSPPPNPEIDTIAAVPGQIPAEVQNLGKDEEALNSLVEEFYTAHDRLPKSIDEMVQMKFIQKAPTPPPGKRYVIDPKKFKIVLVSQ